MDGNIDVQHWAAESDQAFAPEYAQLQESWEAFEPGAGESSPHGDPYAQPEGTFSEQLPAAAAPGWASAPADRWEANPSSTPEAGNAAAGLAEMDHFLLGEMLDEQTLGAAFTEQSETSTFEARDVSPEQFTGIEHKTIGDAASGGAKSILLYGDPPQQLTFGDVVALSGDYFDDLSEMTYLSVTAAGRRQLAWARWDCLHVTGSTAFTEPEPATDPKVKKVVQDRYYRLASMNFSHFSAGGGTAWQTYTKWHATAVAAAFQAGVSKDSQQWLVALTREAFADHYLTDSFSAGHIRTPRGTIKSVYGVMFPSGSEPLVRYMSRFLYQTLDSQHKLPWLLRHLEGMTRGVIEGKIRTLGGEALGTFSLGDIVSKALHDYDNSHGLVVLSDVDATGTAHPGGYEWTAMGDAHLNTNTHGQQTRAMCVAAVGVSIRDLQRVRDAGLRAGPAPRNSGQDNDIVRQALGSPVFEAKRYVPREKLGDPRNPALVATGSVPAPMAWVWGRLGPIAYQAVDATVKGDIADEMKKLSKDMDDTATKYLQTVHGIRGAYDVFVRHLQTEGIRALEAAMGRPAR